nr:DEAD/DEAH box helicase [Pseudoclavibacter sp. Marseille-Q3772]
MSRGRGYKAPGNYVPKRKRGGKLERQRPNRSEQHRGEQKRRSEPHRAEQDRRSEQHRAEQNRGTDPQRTPARESAPPTAPARLETVRVDPASVADISFADLGLDERLITALARSGASAPYAIQAATIPDALAGRNVLGRAQTGSGKTIAFGAALVQRLFRMRGPRAGQPGRAPGALVLAPTRELAVQIDKTIRPLAHALGLYTAQLYGGVTHKNQLTALERGVDIVIGTPGRVNDLAQRGHLDLGQVVIAVLDEADEMSAMGFIDQVERILDHTRSTGQRLLFSATLDEDVRRVIDLYMPAPVAYEIAGEAGTIDHRVYIVTRGDKDAVTAQLARTPGLVLIFMRTKLGVERMVEALKAHEVKSLPLHGDLSQGKRTANLRSFSDGRVRVLVATDMAARGIHVPNVRLVVQADPPDKFKTYLHRAGRTGRAGEQGTVVTLVAPSRREKMRQLLELAEVDVPMIPTSAGGAELDEFGW